MSESIKEILLKQQTIINKSEKLKMDAVEKYIASLAVTMAEHKIKLGIRKFNQAIRRYWELIFKEEQGTDYFSWTPKSKQERDFKEFVEQQLKSKKKLFYCHTSETFFTFKKVKQHCTTRHTDQSKNITINDDGIIHYNHKSFNYNGYRRPAPNGFTQEFEIDTADNKISSHFITAQS